MELKLALGWSQRRVSKSSPTSTKHALGALALTSCTTLMLPLKNRKVWALRGVTNVLEFRPSLQLRHPGASARVFEATLKAEK